jgi:hypothetical protein
MYFLILWHISKLEFVFANHQKTIEGLIVLLGEDLDYFIITFITSRLLTCVLGTLLVLLEEQKKIGLPIILLWGQSIYLMVTSTISIILIANLKFTSPTCSLEETIEILVIMLGIHYKCFHITFSISLLLTSYFNLTCPTYRPLKTIEESIALLGEPYNHLNNLVLLVANHSPRLLGWLSTSIERHKGWIALLGNHWTTNRLSTILAYKTTSFTCKTLVALEHHMSNCRPPTL